MHGPGILVAAGLRTRPAVNLDLRAEAQRKLHESAARAKGRPEARGTGPAE